MSVWENRRRHGRASRSCSRCGSARTSICPCSPRQGRCAATSNARRSELGRYPSVVASALPVALIAAATVSIREFDLPTRDARPHDPAVAPDASLWVTEQNANKLGRLDPKSGRFREYALPRADSGPHGLVADREGQIWFTANYKGYIGKLDPKSGNIAEFPVPIANADPHTPAIDSRGRLWFTMQEANDGGPLDPQSGKFELREVPTRGARPYGIVISAQGVPVFCEFGSNK